MLLNSSLPLSGFQSGSVFFDDENTRGTTDNAVTGSLPKGVYDEVYPTICILQYIGIIIENY